MHPLRYFKAAFVQRWNLLLFLGGMGFALISGYPDVAAPMVMAAEVAYLGLLGTRPRCQQSVDAGIAKAARERDTADTTTTLQQILAALPPETVRQFESLRNRCRELRHLAMAIKDPMQAGEPLPLEEVQLAGLDRLLWIYLRLLYTRFSLQRFLGMEKFLDKSGEVRLKSEINDLEARVVQAGKIADEAQRQRVQATLEDNLQTSRDRLANFQKARDNFELVELEIERLENKIRSLSEMAINRQEPEFISGQVNQVASSMVLAEKTMNDLQFATGLDRISDEAPPMLQQQLTTVKK